MKNPSHFKQAIFSGYTMSHEDFKAFLFTICPEVASDTTLFLDDYVGVYDSWRRRVPKADLARVPKIRIVYKPGLMLNYDITLEERMETFLFPVRWVPYTSEEQLERNDKNISLWEQNDTDKAKLKEFAKFVESQGGKLDVSKLGFGCMKDIHPAFDGRNY